MKTNQTTRRVRGFSLALAASISVLGLAGTANAQSQFVGDDGIAASPKVRAQLNERKARLNATSAAVAPMACPQCKDVWVARADTSSKGSGARTLMGQTTKLVAQHLCPGCATTIAVAGQGKAKHDVATHKCSSCGVENLACCGTTTGTVATKGMEQKFVEIAPIR